jgi:uncharacterized protein YhjY with autotransporter beta-barrel domain
MKPLANPKNAKNLYVAIFATSAALGLPCMAGGKGSILADLELSLVTDISGSVDETEYNLQMDGYAQAFRNSLLHTAIGRGQQGQIAVNLIFFDNTASEGIGWTLLTNASDANAFADLLDNIARPSFGGTNPAAGIDLATASIFGNNIESTRQVIDVSGDGAGNASLDQAARDAALAAGVDAINGLPIGDQSLADYYENNIVGGADGFLTPAATFEDFEASILEKLQREIGGDAGDSGRLVSSTLRATSISSARATTRDVGDRLFRMRAGRPQPMQQAAAPAYVDPGPKGGMSAKSSKSPIVMPAETRNWEVYGSVFAFTEDQDQQILSSRNANGALVQTLVHPDTSVDIFGGNAGFEYRFNERWSAGFALAASSTDVDMTFVGNSDIDTLALVPYVSYYQTNAFAGADLYADAMYVYGMNEYDINRITGGGIASGSPDGDYHQIEVTTGLNFRAGTLVHGPYASLRWLDGTIDSYTETGPGAGAFPSSDYESLATNLGYQVSYPIQLSGGVLVPQGRAAWEHEFEDDQNTALGLPGGEIDEDIAVLGAGIGYYMTSHWNVVLDYEARLGSENQSHYVGLKAGYEF